MRYVVSKNGMYVEKYSCAAERCVLEWTHDVGKAHKFGVNSFIVLRERPRHSCREGIARHAERAPSSRILRLACYLYTGRAQCVNGNHASVQVQVLSDV